MAWEVVIYRGESTFRVSIDATGLASITRDGIETVHSLQLPDVSGTQDHRRAIVRELCTAHIDHLRRLGRL